MAKDLRALDCLQHNPKYSIEYQRAMGLYALGYRKTSEVEACKWSETQYGDRKLCFEINSAKYAELKKKYTEADK